MTGDQVMAQEGERPAGNTTTGPRGDTSPHSRPDFSTYFLSVQDFRFLIRNSSASIVYFECTQPIPTNLSSSDFIAALYTRSSVCLEASNAFIKRAGENTIEDLLGSTISELLPAWRGWNRVFSIWHKSGLSSEAFELELSNQDGSQWTAQCALYGDIQDGVLRKFWLVARDVSCQTKALHALSTIDSHYQAMLNAPNTLSFRILPDGRCERISAAAVALIGLARTGTTSEPPSLGDLIHPEDLDNLMQVFQIRSPESLTIRPISVRCRLREGEYGLFMARRHPICTHSGEVESCDILATRIDKPSPQEPSELCRSARDYHNQIAHDLNNYFMIIESHVRAALIQAPDQTLMQTLVSPALEALQGCKALNAKFFEEPSEPETVRSTSNIATEIGRIAALLVPLVPQTVRLLNDTPAEPLYVLATPFELQQIFVNLLLNAAEAVAQSGSITITLARESGQSTSPAPSEWISIVVQDDGPGVPKHILPFIFESGVTTKTASQHHGLGLCSVQYLVKKLGGNISVTSTTEGTRFTIRLPRALSCLHNLTQVNTVQSEKSPSMQPLRILVADDEPLIIESFRAILTSLGHSVVTAQSRDDVVKSIASTTEKFDVIIMDDRMPSGRASDMIESLRAVSPKTPMIITSGDPMLASTRPLSEHRLTFLPKPCTPAEITKALRSALQIDDSTL